ncbi:hypothetical protein [Sphingomonas sp.]|uniref:hypothetical protein n=1 Tax=Sphingomonas sp. TaxID=28214 RepID=UPI002E325970|nr:hypothetical protein [Sphingomonas sp.]HEX4693779.1 hypothetical protein [Sphingomonas sp.]
MANAPDIPAIMADARWLPYRYDRSRDEVHFVWLPRKTHRELAFLTRPEVAQAMPRHAVPRRLIAEHLPSAQAPLHLIMHSGLTGSTQLTHALDLEDVAMTLSEPPILSDIVRYRLAGATPQQTDALIDDILSLFARPFSPGEAVIVKMNSIGNALGSQILARRPTSKALCLHAPLPLYLASIARKGLEGRIWGRKLFATLRTAGLTDIGFSDEEIFEHTDLQIAADGWLILHRMMGDAGVRFGKRVVAADSEAAIARPEATLTAIGTHFGLNLDAAAIAADPTLARHSKTGEAFDAERRSEELRLAAEVHRVEIERVLAWARQVADVQRIPWALPNQLLD